MIVKHLQLFLCPPLIITTSACRCNEGEIDYLIALESVFIDMRKVRFLCSCRRQKCTCGLLLRIFYEHVMDLNDEVLVSLQYFGFSALE